MSEAQIVPFEDVNLRLASSVHGEQNISIKSSQRLGPVKVSKVFVMQHRRRFKQVLSLHDRLAAWAKEVRQQADALPPGPERDAMLKRLSQADVASRLDAWAKPPGQQPIK